MARKSGGRDKITRKSKRTSYETYVSWTKRYGGDVLSESQFQEAYQIKKRELKEIGKPTSNISRTLAQESSFAYDYKTGLAIRKAYKQAVEEKYKEELDLAKLNENKEEVLRINKLMKEEIPSINEARKLTDINSKVKNPALFWDYVASLYNEELKKNGGNSSQAKLYISQTIFGSL